MAKIDYVQVSVLITVLVGIIIVLVKINSKPFILACFMIVVLLVAGIIGHIFEW